MKNNGIDTQNNTSKAEKRLLWKAAIKWPLYSVAVMPILIAAGWSINQGIPFRWEQLILFSGAGISLLIWENLTNDLFDAETGVDEFKLHSVVALIGKRQPVEKLANIALGFGLFLVVILSQRSNIFVLPIVVASCFLGYLYQGPPFRLGYKGLGEPLCWLAFGPLATTAALLAIAPTNTYVGSIPWSTSLLIGSGPALATTLVLFCSHFHQTVQDAIKGKNTPLVKLGTKKASSLIPWIIALIFIIEYVPVFTGYLPASIIFGLICLPSGFKLIKLLKKHHNTPNLISESKFIALNFQTLNGLGIALGLAFPPFIKFLFT